MKVASQVSEDKLRGGFYSPASLVRLCLDRALEFLGDTDHLAVVEPSAGNGAFIDGLMRHQLGLRVQHLLAIEVVKSEAAACRQRAESASFGCQVIEGSALSWAASPKRGTYDLAIGNPPFVRFQFVDEGERYSAHNLGERLGVEFKGVSNLWLPVFLGSLGSLRPGGVFSFILPSESFTGISGHEIREWLLRHAWALHVDLFPPASFPGVLQEVVVLSGRMCHEGEPPTRDVHLRKHAGTSSLEWTHHCVTDMRTWTRLLLTPDQLAAVGEAMSLPSVQSLGDIAKFEVATVTGANAYFCVSDETVDEWELHPWTRPLLPRTRYAPGLAYTETDHKLNREAGLPCHLLDFSALRPDPLSSAGPAFYLAQGEADELHTRFKTRIRSPWFRVPVVAPGAMMMAKRSHFFPRVIVNEASVTTTDTIYRGRLLNSARVTSIEFTAAFHNSLTLLTAEIEGRSFGGGVLELVPSEILRLAVVSPQGIAEDFDRLDAICRRNAEETNQTLVDATDSIVVAKTPGMTAPIMDQVRSALDALRLIRIARN